MVRRRRNDNKQHPSTGLVMSSALAIVALAPSILGFAPQISRPHRSTGPTINGRIGARPAILPPLFFRKADDPVAWDPNTGYKAYAFEVLEINPYDGRDYTDKNTFKSSFRKMAKSHHPDVVVNKDSTPEEKKAASERFVLINWAYEMLTQDPGMEWREPPSVDLDFRDDGFSHGTPGGWGSGNFYEQQGFGERPPTEPMYRNGHRRKKAEPNFQWWTTSFEKGDQPHMEDLHHNSVWGERHRQRNSDYHHEHSNFAWGTSSYEPSDFGGFGPDHQEVHYHHQPMNPPPPYPSEDDYYNVAGQSQTEYYPGQNDFFHAEGTAHPDPSVAYPGVDFDFQQIDPNKLYEVIEGPFYPPEHDSYHQQHYHPSDQADPFHHEESQFHAAGQSASYGENPFYGNGHTASDQSRDQRVSGNNHGSNGRIPFPEEFFHSGQNPQVNENNFFYTARDHPSDQAAHFQRGPFYGNGHAPSDQFCDQHFRSGNYQQPNGKIPFSTEHFHSGQNPYVSENNFFHTGHHHFSDQAARNPHHRRNMTGW